MADLRIVDAPLLSTVKGTEKIPTGGEGNFSVSVNQVADFAKLKWFLATEGYVDNAVGNVQSDLNLHKNNSSNPHQVTKVQVGLGNVDNTADLDKPVSNATQSAIITANSGKADKSYVDSQDQLKADKTTVEASLLLKADKSYVDSQDQLKADKTTVEASLLLKADNVDLTASKIKSDGNQNQQDINDFGGAEWYNKVGGYDLGATVKLANGDIVKSTVANNVVNPNVDMTGWFNESKQQRELAIKVSRDNQTIYDYGAVGDGTLHTVEEWYTVGAVNYVGYANLLAVQVDYPFVTDKDFSCDQAAILKLSNLKSQKGGGSVDLSVGIFIVKPISNGACLSIPTKVTLVGHFEDTVLHEISDIADDPNVSVNWDLVLFEGSSNVGGGIKNCTIRHTGGRRNNTASVAVRGGASRKKIFGNIFENSIGSCTVSEFDAENPIFLGNKIFGNTFLQSARHQVYLSGTIGDDIYENRFSGYEREAVIIRSSSPTIRNNYFKGSSTNTARACITLAKRADGSAYPTYRGVKIKDNHAYNLYTAFYDGNGQSCHLEDSEISGNEIRQVDDPSVTQHVFMLYVSNRNNLRNNKVFGARRRGFSLGGCSDNDLTGTTLIDVNGAGEAAGSIHLTSYTDFDTINYPSLRNNLSTITAIDSRPVKKQYSGIYIDAGCINNRVSKPNISGFTSAAIALVDGIKSQKIGDIIQEITYTKSALPTGTNAATAMTVGGNSLPAPIVRTGFVSRIRVDLPQQALSGTVTCRLLKNGSTFTNVVFTANGSVRNSETYFIIDQLKVDVGDILTATIESSSITSGQTSLDVGFSILLCD